MRLARIMFGYRDDLDLATRWWHRLLKVTSVLGALCLTGFVFLVLRSPVPITAADVTVLANVRDYTKAHPELITTVPAFEALGRVARRTKEQRIIPYFIPYDSLYCNADLESHADEVANFMTRTSGTTFSTEGARAFLRSDGTKGVCVGKGGPDDPDLGDVLAVKATVSATVRTAAILFVEVFGGVLILSGIVVNLYYRGLVYIICGPRKKRQEQAVSSL